jgi:predicted Zn finger-like uncharacterized protein
VQSRCPNCDTLYHIDRETLAEAEGQARCFRCGTVFDALEQQADDLAASPVEDEPEIGTELELTRLVESLETREDSHERESVPVMLAAAEDDRPRPPPAETSAATTASASATPSTETAVEPSPGATPVAAQAPEAVEQTTPTTSASVEPPALEASKASEASEASGDGSPIEPSPSARPHEELPFDVPDDLPDLQPTETPPDETTIPPRSAARRLLALTSKLVLVLLLLLAGLAQWLWFQPQYLDPVRPYYTRLQTWCAQHDCPFRLPTLPTLRATEAFTILQREISPAEDRPGELRISMTFVNEAEFAQPYPDVLVTLLDHNGGTVTEHRFQPVDYLGSKETGLIEPQQVISFDLLTEDPGDAATGFKLKFL